MNSEIEHREIEANGIQLHVVLAGPAGGQPVILLHGFPEFWYGWRHQIPALAAAGYRVIVPDQRGYNLSDKPKGIGAYNLDVLADDILGLADALGYERFLLAGHDWGAIVAWWLANRNPERIERMAILNVPHPKVMRRTLRSSFKQLRMSWYVFFFQLPRLPERMIGVNILRRMSTSDAFSAEDIKFYEEAFAQPGALTSMVNWYRAIVRRPPRRIAAGSRIHIPVRMIWGVNDSALSVEMAQPSIDLCDEGELCLIDDASHFVQHDAPERVNELLIEWFRQSCIVASGK